jgi:hypothetical protein
VSEDADIELRTVATLALIVRLSIHLAIDLIHTLSKISFSHLARSQPRPLEQAQEVSIHTGEWHKLLFYCLAWPGLSTGPNGPLNQAPEVRHRTGE